MRGKDRCSSSVTRDSAALCGAWHPTFYTSRKKKYARDWTLVFTQGVPKKELSQFLRDIIGCQTFWQCYYFLGHVEPFGPFYALATLLGRFVSSGPLLASLAIFIHIWPHSTLKGFRPLGPFVVILGLILHSASLFFLFFVFFGRGEQGLPMIL